MDLREVVRSLQSPNAAVVSAAVNVLENYSRPLTEKENATLRAFITDFRTQQEAGMKVEEIPDEIRSLQCRPSAAIHPLMVAQCILATSRSTSLSNHVQKRLQRQILPVALLRHPLHVHECAAVLQLASTLPFHLNASCIHAAKSVLRCLALPLFPPQGRTDVEGARLSERMRSAISGSFALPCVKPAVVHGTAAPPPVKVKECSLEDAQQLWWNLLAQVVDVISISYQNQRKHNDKGKRATNEEEMTCRTTLFSASANHHTRLPFCKALSYCGLRFCALLSTQCVQSYSSSAEAQGALEKLSASKQIALASLFSCDTSSSSFILSPATVLSATKTSPGVIHRYFGNALSMDGAVQWMENTMAVGREEGEKLDFMQLCMYNTGLTSLSNAGGFMDYLTVLLAMKQSTAIFHQMLQVKRAEVMEQLLCPFLRNARVLDKRVAQMAAPLYAALVQKVLLSLPIDPTSSVTPVDAVSGEEEDGHGGECARLARWVLDGCVAVWCQRCRTPVEIAVIGNLVLALTFPFYQTASPDGRVVSPACAVRDAFVSAVPLSLPNGLSRFLQRELASPSAESVGMLLRVISAWGIDTASVIGSYQVALTNARKDSSIRSALLLHTPLYEGTKKDHADLVCSDAAQGSRLVPKNERKPCGSPLVALLKEIVITPLLHDCVEVEISRPDAFLSLWFVCHAPCFEAEKKSGEIFQKVLPLLCSAEVLKELLSLPESSEESFLGEEEALGSIFRQPWESALHGKACRVLEVAQCLSLAHCFTPLLRVMTHSSRFLQRQGQQFLEHCVQRSEDAIGAEKTFHHLVLPMWRSLVSDVMGLTVEGEREDQVPETSVQKKKTGSHTEKKDTPMPAILSSSAEASLHTVGRLVLSYLARDRSSGTVGVLQLSQQEVCRELAAFLCCMGHDSIQGRDDAFFSLLEDIKIRPPSSALLPVQSATLLRFFSSSSACCASGVSMSLLVSSVSRAKEIMRQLLEKLQIHADHSPYRIAATCRAVTLFFVLLSQYYSNGKGYSVVRAPEESGVPDHTDATEMAQKDGAGDASSMVVPEPPLQVCFAALRHQLRQSMMALSQRSARDVVLASGSVGLEIDYVQEVLHAQHLIKTYSDRPPKGVTMDDFMDQKKRDGLALAKGKEGLEKELNTHRQAVQRDTRILLAPLLIVRLLGATKSVDDTAISTFFPYLLRRLCRGGEASSTSKAEEEVEEEEEEQERKDFFALVRHRRASSHDDEVAATALPLPSFLQHLYMDGIRGLLSRTPIACLAEVLTSVIVRVSPKRYLEATDISQFATLSLVLRRSLVQMLSPPLFVVLIPFCRVAFKAGRSSSALTTSISVATQHQLLSVLLQNVSQPSLPQPTLAMELMMLILHNFPALYKGVLQGVQALMPLLPSKHLMTVEIGFFDCGDGDGVRDVIAVSFPRYTHFASCRRALVLAQIFLDDDGKQFGKLVLSGMEDILRGTHKDFHLAITDWTDLLYFLRAYGEQKRNAIAIATTMIALFTMATQQYPERAESLHLQWVSELCEVEEGLGSVIALHVLSSYLHPKAAVQAIEYLCTLAESGAEIQMDALLREVLDSGREVLQAMELDTLQAVGAGLQSRFARPPKALSTIHKEQYLAISTVWLTVVACRLQASDVLQSIIEQQSRTLNNSQSLMVHRAVYESMTEITKHPLVRKMPELDEFVEKCLKQCFHTGSYVKKKAHAWGVAGVISGLTLPGLRRYDIVNRVRLAGQEKQTERIGAMVLVEVLCDGLGRRFEPYALTLADTLLQGVGDADTHVSACADDAVQVMMRKCLSGIGLRQLIPHLIAILSSDQAKRRVAPLNFIGHVAFCSPKQLAATLPLVMKSILPCLFEVNSLVSSAAFSALRRVAGVVSNPEIKEQVENIFNAMRSPSTETENALDALLYTRFVNVVDPASLALIIPVLSRGLSGQVRNTRPKAAQIVATMVTLVRDRQSLSPYVNDLIQLLETAAQDPEPEARTTSAKALSALCGAIGLHLVHRVVSWSFDVLQKSSSGTIEKAGASQVFVEMVSPYGTTLLKQYIHEVEKGMKDERPAVREGYLYIMVYAPSSFEPGLFQRFLPRGFPWVLSGLSHYSDRVRDVALTAGESIIAKYGTENLRFMLGPLLKGASSEITTLRQSSLLLASKLLLHLSAHVRKKARIQRAAEERQRELQGGHSEGEGGGDTHEADKEEHSVPLGEGESGVEGGAESSILTIEAARDVEKRGVSVLSAIEECVGTERFLPLFSAVYCGCHEHSMNVRTDCSQAWQACVASIRAAVKKIFPALTKLLIHFASSNNVDCVEVAEKTIEYTSRMQETLQMFVQALCDAYKANEWTDPEMKCKHEKDSSDDDHDEDEEDDFTLSSDEEEEGKGKEAVGEHGRKHEKKTSGGKGGARRQRSDGDASPRAWKEEKKTRVRRGCLMCLASFVKALDKEKLIAMGGQLVGCILPGMQDGNVEVQAVASKLFEEVTNKVGARLIEDVVEAQLHSSIRGVIEVVKVRPQVALEIIFRHFQAQKDFTDHDLELLREIVDVSQATAELLKSKYITCTMEMLLSCLRADMDGANLVAQNYIAVSYARKEDVFEMILKASRKSSTRFGAVRLLEAYGLATKVDQDEENLKVVFQVLVMALGEEDDIQLRSEAGRILPILISHLEKAIVEETLSDEELSDFTVTKRTSGRYLAQYVEVVRVSFSTTVRSRATTAGEAPLEVLAEGEPRVFDALMNLYQRGLDYGSTMEKEESVEGMQDLMEFAPKAVSASTVNTVAGRCTKCLFARNEGTVALALLKLCTKLLQYPANGKEKMVESTMTLALFSASLCDFGEARQASLQLMVKLLQRSDKYAELILGNVMTKKSAVVDHPLYRTVLCRFISVVMRYSHFTRKYMQIPKLMELVRPIWEECQTPAEAAAGGVAVGALCMSQSVSEEELQEVKELALRMLSSPGLASIAGFAAVYSLLTAARERVDDVFIHLASDALGSTKNDIATNKFATIWKLRAGGAVASTGILSEANFHAERFLPAMRRLLHTDVSAMSTAQYFVDHITTSYPASAIPFEIFPCAYSAACVDGFDADFDDELTADQMQ